MMVNRGWEICLPRKLQSMVIGVEQKAYGQKRMTHSHGGMKNIISLSLLLLSRGCCYYLKYLTLALVVFHICIAPKNLPDQLTNKLFFSGSSGDLSYAQFVCAFLFAFFYVTNEFIEYFLENTRKVYNQKRATIFALLEIFIEMRVVSKV